MGTIVILVVYLLTNLSLPVFMWRRHRTMFSPLRHVAVPALGSAILVVPFIELCEPGQPSPYSTFPFIALGLVAVGSRDQRSRRTPPPIHGVKRSHPDARSLSLSWRRLPVPVFLVYAGAVGSQEAPAGNPWTPEPAGSRCGSSRSCRSWDDRCHRGLHAASAPGPPRRWRFPAMSGARVATGSRLTIFKGGGYRSGDGCSGRAEVKAVSIC